MHKLFTYKFSPIVTITIEMSFTNRRVNTYEDGGHVKIWSKHGEAMIMVH